METAKACAIIVAAGSSKRMNGIDKIFTPLLRKPVIAHTIEAFENVNCIDSIIIVMPMEKIQVCNELVFSMGYRKVHKVCVGGDSRQASVYNGLAATPPAEFIVIHDGARPCVSKDVIEQGINVANIYGTAVATSAVSDTIKRVDDKGYVINTIDRNTLRMTHTPQVFRRDIILEVHSKPSCDATDDAGLAELHGYKVATYEDSTENIKITTPIDLTVAEAILLRRGKKLHNTLNVARFY